MANKRRILTVILLIAAVGMVSWLILSQPGEPIYQGKPLSFWCFQDATNSFLNPNGQADKQAETAIRSIGSNAVPTLLRWLTAKDSEFKRKLIQLTQKQHFINIKWRTAELQHFEAEMGFRCLSSDGISAVPSLIEIYEEHRSDTNSYLRLRAVAALGIIHANPSLAVPALTKCLNDPVDYVRANAAFSLGTFGTDAKSAVAELVHALDDTSSFMKSEASSALKKIDPEAAAKAGVK